MTASPSIAGFEARQCLPPLAPSRRPKSRLPDDACDTHSHVFGPTADYPLAPDRSYTPAIATIDDYREVMTAYGIARAVLVQPSVYGFDNSALLNALEAMPGALRGVAVISPDAPEDAFAGAHRLGVRGIRINPRNPAGLTIKDAPRIAKRIAPYGWHIQLQISIEEMADFAAFVADTSVPVVIDHFGFPNLALGPAATSFSVLVDLAATGRCFVKLSAPYRVTDDIAGYALLTPFVERLVHEAPDALLWGLDWPHTERFETVPDDSGIIDLAGEWLPTEDLARKVLCRNPSRLYWAD